MIALLILKSLKGEVGMSATIIAASSASANSSNETKLKKIKCEIYEQKFNSTTATVEQKQQYADCIQLLHPCMTGVELLFAKFLVVLSFVFFVIGGWLGFKEERSLIFSTLIGVLSAVFVPLMLFLVVSGVIFLFS